MASASDEGQGDTVTSDVQSRLDELEERLAAIEGIFSQRVVDKERAHTKAVERDAREQLSVGEERTVVLQEAPSPATEDMAVTRIEGIVTFVKCSEEVGEGDTLTVRIADVQENHAHAVAI